MTYEMETHVNNGASPSALNKKIWTTPSLLPLMPQNTNGEKLLFASELFTDLGPS